MTRPTDVPQPVVEHRSHTVFGSDRPGPGPSAYNITGTMLSSDSRKLTSQGAKFGSSSRFKERLLARMQTFGGESAYNPSSFRSTRLPVTLQFRPGSSSGARPQSAGGCGGPSPPYISAPSYIGQGPKVGFAQSKREGPTNAHQASTPGPGYYSPVLPPKKSTMRPTSAATTAGRGFGAFGTAPRCPPVPMSEGPGPKYNPVHAERLIRSSSPMVGFGTSTRGNGRVDREATPGAGSYTPSYNHVFAAGPKTLLYLTG